MALAAKFLIVCVLVAAAPLTLSHVRDFRLGHSTLPPANKWGSYFPLCSGNAQSPIDIVTADVSHNDKLNDIVLSDNYALPLEGAEIRNDGYTVEIRPGKNDELRTIHGGSLDGVYQFEYLTMHWESEHTIGGRRFPLEMQLEHSNTKYTYDEAAHANDDVIVLAVLFEFDVADNPALEPILDKLGDIPGMSDSVKLDANFTLSSLLPRKSMPYYRYEGSITIPPCFESVKWTVFEELVPISRRQYYRSMILRRNDLAEYEPIENNSRPIQNLNNRVVQVSGDARRDSTDHTGSENDGGPLGRQDEGRQTGATPLNLQLQLPLGVAGTSGKACSCTCS